MQHGSFLRRPAGIMHSKHRTNLPKRKDGTLK